MPGFWTGLLLGYLLAFTTYACLLLLLNRRSQKQESEPAPNNNRNEAPARPAQRHQELAAILVPIIESLIEVSKLKWGCRDCQRKAKATILRDAIKATRRWTHWTGFGGIFLDTMVKMMGHAE